MSNTWDQWRLGQICQPKQWPTIGQDQLRTSGFPVFGANGQIGYYSRYTHECETIAITCRGATCGAVHVTPPRCYITGNAMALDELDGARAYHPYLANVLRHRGFLDCITGSAQPQIIGSAIRQVAVQLPPLPEQRLIAEILDTVDEAIRKTEQIIAKLEQVKQGLLHDLLTRGIDDNGQLRDPDRQPEQFKDSELGRIPVSWRCEKFGDVIGRIVSGWSPVCDPVPATSDEWAVLKTTACVWTGYNQLENKRLPAGLTGDPRIEVAADDILITRKGPLERVGVVVHVKETRPKLMIPDTVFRTRLIPDSKVLPAFLPLALGAVPVQANWFRKKIGLADAQVNLNHSILRSTWFPKPGLGEQEAIVRVALNISRIHQTEEEQLGKLRLVKQGLMDDLLTGRVRVTELLQETAG